MPTLPFHGPIRHVTRLVLRCEASQANKELARRDTGEEHFAVFVAGIILHRNAQICFHNHMVTEGVVRISRAQWRARASVQYTNRQSYNHSSSDCSVSVE